MMSSKKRCYFLFCSLLLLGLLAAGCQGAAPAATGTPRSTGTATVTPTRVKLVTNTPVPTPTLTTVPINVDSARLKDTQILLQYSWSGAARQALETLIVEFNRTNTWGIIARAEQVGDSQVLYAQLENQLVHASYDSLPNLIAAAPEQITSLNDQETIMTNLAPYIADRQYGLSVDEQKAIADIFWLQDRPLVGVQTGLPAQRNLALLFYNTTWAQELGYTQPPATPDEFRQQACAAAKVIKDKGDPDTTGTGGWIVNTEPETIMSWMYAFDGVILPQRPSQPYNFNTPGNQKTITYFYSLFNNDCAWVSRQPTPYDYFARRQALMYSGDLTDIAVQARMNAHDSASDAWTVIPYPTTNSKPQVLAGGISYAVLRHGDVPDLAAWLLARWLNQPEHQALLSQAAGTMPVSSTAFASLGDYESAHPQWKEAVSWQDKIQPLPGIGSWQAARLVVSDAGWQIFHPRPTPDSPSTLLDQLDRTIYDVLIHKP
jgi:ABC-type glycerol-3-phosphate transport system substrate-binding protein